MKPKSSGVSFHFHRKKLQPAAAHALCRAAPLVGVEEAAEIPDISIADTRRQQKRKLALSKSIQGAPGSQYPVAFGTVPHLSHWSIFCSA